MIESLSNISPQQTVSHLDSAVWKKVNTHLIAKAIGEFAHELLIAPTPSQADGTWTWYVLPTDRSETEYRFRAQRLALDHWFVDRESIRKVQGGADLPLDAMLFIVELRDALEIPKHVLPGYLEEIASTLFAAAYKQSQNSLSASELTRCSFQQVETAMTEGHPIFVANNGRIGFNAEDYRKYAPEAALPMTLEWLAAKKERADFACVSDLSYSTLIQEELSPSTLDAFSTTLRARGAEPSDYVFLPVHPWQWQNRVAQLYAADLASGALVYLGRSEDEYLAQQSIRTLYNISRPHKRYVKTALSILNMGFTRGLASTATSSWAAVNDWALQLVQNDPYLDRLGMRLLREVAFVGFRHHYYERASSKRSDSRKEMLAALWRENPSKHVQPGQRLMTMASLMHCDRDGGAVLTALIHASDLSVERWLQHYLCCYLTPLLHCFYAHNFVLTPHCENVILVLEGHVPVRMIIKDIAEDIGVLNPETSLPEAVRHLALSVPEEVMTLSIFTDVFDCVFRFLAQILVEHAQFSELRFWELVAQCIHDYEREQPQLAEKFRRYDLFAPEFIRNCLNRLQLRNNRMMVDLNAVDPVESLRFVGSLSNPVARFRDLGRASKDEVSHGIA